MRRSIALLLLLPSLSVWAGSPAPATTLAIACSAVGIEYRLCRDGARTWARSAGHQVEIVQSPNLSNGRLGLYRQILAARSPEVDVFQIDVIWPGMLGAHLIDLTPYVPREEIGAHFPAIIRNNTVAGELKALPWYTDVGLLFYRRDLLEKHGKRVPRTWRELAETASYILRREKAGGNTRLNGFVFQGRAYEGLTCNALEWIAAYGGGRIVTPAGNIDLNNGRAAEALRMAASWVGTVSPRGVLTYAEEEARGVFQSGQAVFMRNWPYAWALANGPDSPVKGKVEVAALPGGPGRAGGLSGAGTLGGWNLAVSKYSRHPALAAGLARYLTGAKEQARRAILGGYNPTRPALYLDPAVLAAHPFFARLPDLLANAVARPSAIAGAKYNRLSVTFWEAVHDVLAGRDAPRSALAAAERKLRRLSRGGRW